MTEDELADLHDAQQVLLNLLRSAVAAGGSQFHVFNWEETLELARLHQVDHYLYTIVSSWRMSFLPELALLKQWRNAFYSAAMHYARAEVQAKELLGSLYDAGVKVVPLKGVWAAERLYEDGACRPMCDFDLLVRADQFDSACSVFDKLGYTTPDHFLDLERDKHVHYRHPVHPMMVELHWKMWHETMVAVSQVDSEKLWDDVSEDKLHGIPVSVFSYERQLIYFSQHILHHEMTMPLRSYLDLALMIEKYGELYDLSRLRHEAQIWRVPFGARFIIRVVCDLFSISPKGTLLDYLGEMESFKEEREAAVSALLGMTSESGKMTPALEASAEGSIFRMIRLGVKRVFLPKAMIIPAYPKAVKKYGILGGYAARFKDLIERQGDMLKKVGHDDAQSIANRKNYRVRRDLSAWLHDKDMPF